MRVVHSNGTCSRYVSNITSIIEYFCTLNLTKILNNWLTSIVFTFLRTRTFLHLLSQQFAKPFIILHIPFNLMWAAVTLLFYFYRPTRRITFTGF